MNKKNLNKMIKTSKFEDAKYGFIVLNIHENNNNETKEKSSRRHINELSSKSTHGRAMQQHSFASDFQKTAQVEYDAIENRDTGEVIDRFKAQKMKIISLKGIFKYKIDENNYLTKFKARIVVRENLQGMKNAQDVYATTLTIKMFRMLITMIALYNLKTRQLDAVNAFLNITNDEFVFYYMSDDYRLTKKI